MAVKVVINSNRKYANIAAEKSLLGRLLILAIVSLAFVSGLALIPIPWSLGLPDGVMVKTWSNKCLLFKTTMENKL